MQKTRIEIAADELEKCFGFFTREFGYDLTAEPAHDTIIIFLEPTNDIVAPADMQFQLVLKNKLNHTFHGFPLHISFKNALAMPALQA